MLPQYSKKEIFNILQKLPLALREMLTSDEFLDAVDRISERYEIDYPRDLATIAGRVLMGLLNPEDFEKTIKAELKLKPDVAKKVNHEMRRFIFAPVKNELSELYQYEFTPVAKPVEAPRAPREGGTTPTPRAKQAPGEDTYREPLE